MKNKIPAYVDHLTGNFKHINVELLDELEESEKQIDKLINEYFDKCKTCKSRKFSSKEKLLLSNLFKHFLLSGKTSPSLLAELLMPTTDKPFKDFIDGTLVFHKPAELYDD